MTAVVISTHRPLRERVRHAVTERASSAGVVVRSLASESILARMVKAVRRANTRRRIAAAEADLKSYEREMHNRALQMTLHRQVLSELRVQLIVLEQ